MINSIYLICSDIDTHDIAFHGVFHSLREVDEFFYDKMIRDQTVLTEQSVSSPLRGADRVDDEQTFLKEMSVTPSLREAERARLYGWAVRSVRDINVGRYVTVASVRGRWFHIYRYLPNDVSRTIHFAVTKDLSEPAGLVDFHAFSERYEDAVDSVFSVRKDSDVLALQGDSVPNCYDDLGGENTHIAEIFNFTLL